MAVKDQMMRRRRLKKAYLYLRRADRTRVVLLLSASFLILVIASLFMFLFVQDIALAGKIFPGVTIDGNSVGGMSRDQARAAIDTAVAARVKDTIVMKYDERVYKLDPAKIGLAIDVDKMVEEAFGKGGRQNLLARMWRRFLNKPIEENIPIMMKYDEAGLKGFIAGVGENLDYSARNASVDMSKGYPVVSKSKSGRRVRQDELLKKVEAALPTSNRSITVPVETVAPKVSESDIGPIIVIKQSAYKLYMYDGSTLDDTYTVAVGEPKYPTPNGRFEILEKKKDPWWYPPKSDWAKDKKPIPPGPGNPLGPYWMDLGNGFGIHSTPDEASLGYSASHGCIRMSEWGAMQLFNMVKVGTPVYIVP
jgi:lipoprotein-anchoring transpeptidase ErfK/SrfK